MQNLMPQLDLPGKMVQQPKASQSSGRTGKKGGGDDDFRNLLQSSSKGDAPKENDTISRTDRPEKTEVDRQGDTAKKDDTAKEDPLQAAEAGMQAFRLMLMGNAQSEDLQIVTEQGSSLQQPETGDLLGIVSLTDPAPGQPETADFGGGVLSLQDLTEGTIPTEQVSDLGMTQDPTADVREEPVIGAQAAQVSKDYKETRPETGSVHPRETVTKEQDAVPKVSQLQPRAKTAENTAQQPQDTEKGTDQNGYPDAQAHAAGNIIRQDPFQRQLEGTAGTVPTVHVRVSSPQDLINSLMDQLQARTALKEQGFEIWLHPENLGKLAIKVAYTAEKVSISIVCSNERTMELLSSGAKNIAQIMEENLGAPTTVMVEQGENDYLEQYNNQEDPRRQQQEQQEEEKKPSEGEHQDFLQQLRLGLI